MLELCLCADGETHALLESPHNQEQMWLGEEEMSLFQLEWLLREVELCLFVAKAPSAKLEAR